MKTKWNNRICGHDEVDPSTLNMHDLNWRVHTDEQRRALAAAIDDVGFVRSVLVSKRTGTILDGHLRVTLAIADNVRAIPVEYVDVDEAEEAEILATLDPLSAMAGADPSKLADLATKFDLDSHDLKGLIDGILGDFDPLDDDEGKPDKTEPNLPEMELKPYEHYDYVLVLCTRTTEWLALCEKLGIEKEKCTRVNGASKVGIGRAVSAAKLLELLK